MQRAGFVTLPAVPPNPAVQLHQGDGGIMKVRAAKASDSVYYGKCHIAQAGIADDKRVSVLSPLPFSARLAGGLSWRMEAPTRVDFRAQ